MKLISKILCTFLVLCSSLIADTPPFEIDTLQVQAENDFNTATPDQFESAFKRMLWILAGILLLVFITIWMFKRLMKTRIEQTNRISGIKILEKRPLSQKTMLYLVEMEGKKVMLSESHLEIRKIESLKD